MWSIGGELRRAGDRAAGEDRAQQVGQPDAQRQPALYARDQVAHARHRPLDQEVRHVHAVRPRRGRGRCARGRRSSRARPGPWGVGEPLGAGAGRVPLIGIVSTTSPRRRRNSSGGGRHDRPAVAVQRHRRARAPSGGRARLDAARVAGEGGAVSARRRWPGRHRRGRSPRAPRRPRRRAAAGRPGRAEVPTLSGPGDASAEALGRRGRGRPAPAAGRARAAAARHALQRAARPVAEKRSATRPSAAGTNGSFQIPNPCGEETRRAGRTGRPASSRRAPATRRCASRSSRALS